jgi:hypothetical protein
MYSDPTKLATLSSARGNDHLVSGTAKHNVAFNVSAPGGYRIDVFQDLYGDPLRNEDDFDCEGSAGLGGVAGTYSGLVHSGTLNRGAHSVPGLPAGVSHTATVKVTIPANTPLAGYSLIACADDQGAVEERDEADNCIAGPTVTVARPDLVASVVSSPPATAARGAKVKITEMVTTPARPSSPCPRRRRSTSTSCWHVPTTRARRSRATRATIVRASATTVTITQ